MIPVSQARVDGNWRAICVELDAPAASRCERLLGRVGVSTATARIIAATPALRRSWFVAVAVVGVVGLTAQGSADAAVTRNNLFAFLLLAPLAGLFGVAMAYGPDADPSHEIALATPRRGLRLLLLRACTVQAASTAILGLVSLRSGAGWMGFAWILPSAGLTALASSLMTVLSPRRAAAVAGGGWLTLGLLSTALWADRLTLFGPVGQAGAAAAVVAGLGAVHLGRARLDVIGRPT